MFKIVTKLSLMQTKRMSFNIKISKKQPSHFSISFTETRTVILENDKQMQILNNALSSLLNIILAG